MTGNIVGLLSGAVNEQASGFTATFEQSSQGVQALQTFEALLPPEAVTACISPTKS